MIHRTKKSMLQYAHDMKVNSNREKERELKRKLSELKITIEELEYRYAWHRAMRFNTKW